MNVIKTSTMFSQAPNKNKHVINMFQTCYKHVTSMLQACYKQSVSQSVSQFSPVSQCQSVPVSAIQCLATKAVTKVLPFRFFFRFVLNFFIFSSFCYFHFRKFIKGLFRCLSVSQDFSSANNVKI